VYQGSFIGYIGTRPDNVEKALKVMYSLVNQIRTEPVSDEELTNVKDYLKGSFVFDIESTGQLAGLLVQIERYQLGNDYLVKYADAIDKVTAADVQRVAAKYLVPEQMVEVISGPIQKITAAEDAPGSEETPEGGK
jgi:zinc protease